MAEVQQFEPCPIVPTLGRGTAGQSLAERDNGRDTTPGNLIKSLANRVIERDKARDIKRDNALSLVPIAPAGRETSGTRHPSQNWLPEDWRSFYEERAGILEHDNNLPRAEAERVAYGTALAKWMDAHRPPTDRLDECAHCRGNRPGAALIPCLSASGGRYGVHDKCLPDLLEGMRQRGIAALSEYGLAPSLGERI